MRVEKNAASWLVVFLCTGLLLGGQGKDRKSEKKDSKAPGSLIRKELLVAEKKELTPPQRNIFSPHRSGIGEEMKNLGVTQDVEVKPENSEPKTPSFSTGLRYIGYVQYGQRIVALIIFEGQAAAVEKGDRISGQVEAGDITTKDIEIIGPGAEIKKYPLQGEEE
ncbi:MAG: hypothetical protein ACLFVG_01750 [Candidatus Aminicenantes bacterium]